MLLIRTKLSVGFVFLKLIPRKVWHKLFRVICYKVRRRMTVFQIRIFGASQLIGNRSKKTISKTKDVLTVRAQKSYTKTTYIKFNFHSEH